MRNLMRQSSGILSPCNRNAAEDKRCPHILCSVINKRTLFFKKALPAHKLKTTKPQIGEPKYECSKNDAEGYGHGLLRAKARYFGNLNALAKFLHRGVDELFN